MKSTITKFAIGVLLVGSSIYVVFCPDEDIEIDASTGSLRARTTYARIIETDWNVQPTWISESAARQGVSAVPDWRHLSTISRSSVLTSRACSSAPVSYSIRSIDPSILNLMTTEEIDRFVREFLITDEAKRAYMISVP